MRTKIQPQPWCGPGRLRVVAYFGALAWLALAGRLVQVQGLLGDAYAARARAQYVRQIELVASRGSILDRRGTELATDVAATSFYAHPARVVEPERTAAYFAPLSRQSVAALYEQLSSKRSFVYLARQVADVELVNRPAADFAGVFSHAETRRFYPLGPLAGQLLGHTNIDNEGREGVERAFGNELEEEDGVLVSYVDARGRFVPGRVESQTVPQNGRSLVLTIDALYQGILEEELLRTLDEVDAASARGIILDPRTGEIIAMANAPLFDPNEAGNSPAALRRNRVIADAYEPGSTFKVIAAAAVLEDGLALLHERVYCEEGVLKLSNGDVIRDISPHGELSFVEVIENSSNIGLIKFARRLPRPRFYEYIRRFGFATRSGIDLPAESAGQLQNVEGWSERSLETIAIGQEIGVSVLQLAQAYAAIANGGKLMVPQVAKGYIGVDGQIEGAPDPKVLRRVISEKTSLVMRQILRGVVDHGTGHRARIAGVSVAGKTGTAQKAASDGRGYDPDASIVSFAGFLPVESPQFVCVIVVDEPQKEKWGGSVAAPAFQRVMERIVHLPGGLLAGSVLSGIPAATIAVPDLRGMTRAAAQLAARLRGVGTVLTGRGNIIVRQSPLAGEEILAGADMRCELGGEGELVEGVIDLGRRQARLLELMGPPRIISDTKGI
jgi:cell division protein FtsI/penicillin-binding protein 2